MYDPQNENGENVLIILSIPSEIYYFESMIISAKKQRTNIQANLLAGQKELKKQLQRLVKESSFQNISSESKNLTRICTYFMKLHSNKLVPGNKFRKLIESVLDSFKVIVDSTEYQKNGHMFSYLQYIVRKGQREQSTIDNYHRSAKNQEDPYYQITRLKKILPEQLKNLKKPSINLDLNKISNCQIRLPNRDCIFCSEVLIKNFEISNINPQYPCVIGLKQSQWDKMTLQKYICAICNAGGGTLIIGAQRSKDKLMAKGMTFRNMQDLQQKLNELMLSMTSIKPQFSFLIKKVQVHTNYLTQDNPENQINRYCYMIRLKPSQKNKKYFIQIINKGYHSIYQVYELENYKPYYRENDDGNDNFYSLAKCRYYKKLIIPRSSHYMIQCCQAYLHPSTIYSQFIIDSGNKIGEQKIKDQTEAVTDQPKFKYTFTSLLAVGSKKKDSIIKNLISVLKSKKMMVQAEKPFTNSFKNGLRSIWMMSHNDKHQIIKNCVKQCDNSGAITLIPVYKTLQIDSLKLTQEFQQQIEHKFKQRYPNGYKTQEIFTQDENGNTKNAVFFSYDCFTQAIYAYMIFESHQLRPYFVKQNTNYKKKPKHKSE